MKNYLIFLILILISSTIGIKITCEFSFASFLGIGSVYMCDVITIDYMDDPTYFTSANGTHRNGYSNLNVKHMQFYRAKIGTSFPKGLLNVFPNLIGLVIVGSQLNGLKGDELYEYPNLQLFTITDTKITRIPPNFFYQTPNLKNVGFDRTKTENVPENLFDNLKNLTVIYFTGNTCLNKNAYNATDVQLLIQDFKVYCPDIAPTCEAYVSTVYICK